MRQISSKILVNAMMILFIVNAVQAGKVHFSGAITCEAFKGDWSEMPDFDSLIPSRTEEFGKDGQLWNGQFKMPFDSLPQKIAFRYKGAIIVPCDDEYSFGVEVYNPCELYVDGVCAIKADKSPGQGWQMGKSLKLKAGRHRFSVKYLCIKGRRQGLRIYGEPMIYPVNPKHWLYIGWENDYPKSLTYMGGTLEPGRGRKIQYVIESGGKTYSPDEYAANRRKKIKWYLADGYMPSPVSQWKAGPVDVKIQHFAVRKDDRHFHDATVVYSQVSVANNTSKNQKVSLKINAGMNLEVPLTRFPDKYDEKSMAFDISLEAGKCEEFDFVCKANGVISLADMRGLGGFEDNYAFMKQHYEKRLAGLCEPVSLPDKRMVEMYKSNQIVMLDTIVVLPNGDYAMRASGGNPAGLYQYDRTFSHDVPNMVIQFLKEGDIEVAKNIMESDYYQKLGEELELDYLDAIPKYIIPYATYLQVTGDRDYFTPKRRALLKNNSKRIHKHREKQLKDEMRGTGHYGIMDRSNGLDNGSDYLVIDNFAALHGLAAYEWLSEELGEKKEAQWARSEMIDLNSGLNKALEVGMKRRGVDYYMANLDDTGPNMSKHFWKMGYSGNWIGTTLMMPTFPWGAELKGFDLGGTWKDHFDRTIEHSLEIRNDHPVIPEGSWGAWWGNEYGTVYNAAMGFQTLASDKYRTLAVKNLEWLLENESAPYQWGENFDKGLTDDDWTILGHDYETWGLSFMKQALLEACISVKTDGTVIVGRGIPNKWLEDGGVIAWKNVRVNKGRVLDMSISTKGKTVTLKIEGDEPFGRIIFNLPVFVNNIAEVVADGKTVKDFDFGGGVIKLPRTIKEAKVRLIRPLDN